MATSLSDRVLAHLTSLGDLARLAEWRYEYREAIGRGGMGVVHRAWDRELERDVAVKVLDAAGPGMAARLVREARIIARLEHPGVVPIYDVGHTADGRVAYVMKLVRGERLDAAIARGINADEAFRIFGRIGETIAFAHARGVVHRDLKPQNIMLGAFGEVLVLDWGIAKAGDEPAAAGAVMGTPGYMAPEQASGRSADADARADVYGLGGILAALFPAPPRPLAAVTAKAQAAAAADRYPDALALAADVRRVAAGQSVSVYRESLPELAGRFFTRHQSAINLVLVYIVVRLLLLLGGGG